MIYDPRSVRRNPEPSRDEAVWKEVCERIRAYARAKGRRVLITANGLNRHVDHQIQNLWDNHLFLDKEKRVDARQSLFSWGRDLVHKSRTLLGREVPIVVFHDWGFGMPWQNISKELLRMMACKLLLMNPVEIADIRMDIYAPWA